MIPVPAAKTRGISGKWSMHSSRPRRPRVSRYARRIVSPEDIKALRTTLQCTTRELGDAIGVEQKTVLAWEGGQLFPTKKHVDLMLALKEKGPSAIPRKARGASPPPLRVLADPALWELLRKLVAHKKLRDEVVKLAASYDDPAERE
jgi:DNA-binding transcriptional regulator YiaG